MIVTRTLNTLPGPTRAERDAIHAGPVSEEAFRQAFADLPALHAVEIGAPPQPAVAAGATRIAFWNAERLKYGPSSAGLLRSVGAPVIALAEVDVGMARSGNRHTVRDLATALEAGFVFATEFVELDLGDARERGWHAGETNREGLHGAGFVATLPMRRPALVRLETSGRWFDGVFGERRVGGRIAVMVEVEIAGEPVLVVSAHYESHTNADDRLAQTRVLLDAVDAHAPGLPVLIGGDFNTSTFTLEEKRDPALVAATLATDPDRLVRPMPYEPMFAELERRGYDWAACNDRHSTQRTRPDGTPPPPFGRIDWFFARGLACSDAMTIPAIDRHGIALSDHEVLVVTVAPVSR